MGRPAPVGGSPATRRSPLPTPPPASPVVLCAGVPISAYRPDAAARAVCAWAGAPRASGMDVHLCNAYTLALADRDDELHALLRRAALNLPDGKSVVWANRLAHRGRGLPTDRVSGTELLRAVFQLGQASGLRHYLLGSTRPVLDALAARLRQDYPGAVVVGAEDPPFRALTDAERRAQQDRIRASGAQLVWVGLGTPKQDWEAARLAGELPVVAVAVGAAFDFVAGTKRQAPAWMQRHGLEWCYRLGQEPRRLWRRYLFGNARFLYAVCRQPDRRPSRRGG